MIINNVSVSKLNLSEHKVSASLMYGNVVKYSESSEHIFVLQISANKCTKATDISYMQNMSNVIG